MLNSLTSQLRTIWTILQHTFTKAQTVQYPEEMPYLAPRYRGRIVLTRDPDGEERCVACNLCAVACPVDCIALQQGVNETGRWYPEVFRINFSRCIMCWARFAHRASRKRRSAVVDVAHDVFLWSVGYRWISERAILKLRRRLWPFLR